MGVGITQAGAGAEEGGVCILRLFPGRLVETAVHPRQPQGEGEGEVQLQAPANKQARAHMPDRGRRAGSIRTASSRCLAGVDLSQGRREGAVAGAGQGRAGLEELDVGHSGRPVEL